MPPPLPDGTSFGGPLTRPPSPLQEQTATTQIAPALSVSGIHLAYSGIAALAGIDLDLGRGEFVALLGPSGCGKTSLLRAIAGFVQPQRGAVRLNGRDVAGLPPRRRNIGIVFQSYALFPHMSVLDNVLFGLECRKIGKAEAATRARRTLDLVGLSALADRRPKQLSGGQQQRVALARAIVIEPDLLLLDEPLGALDKQLRVQMQTELKSLQRRLGVTALFVTHDQEEAMSMADRIVVMRDGRIVQADTPEALFNTPNSAWVCDFVGGGNLLRGALVPDGSGYRCLDIAPGSRLRVGATEAGSVMQVPFDKVRLRPCAAGEGLLVTGRRFLGAVVELHLHTPVGIVRAHLPQAEADGFPLGASAHIAADPAHCRVLPD